MHAQNFAAENFLRHLCDWNEYYARFYSYPVPKFESITGATPNPPSFQSTLNIQQDWPFCVLAITASVWEADYENLHGASAPLYAPDDAVYNIAVQAFDQGASNFLFADAIQLRTLGGDNGKNRFELPVPYLIEKNTNVTWTLIDSDTRTVDVQITLHGFKIVKRPVPIKQGHHKVIEDFHKLPAPQQAAVAAHAATVQPNATKHALTGR